MENGFVQLGVAPKIIKAIEEMGFERPTNVQSESIPKVLDKKDLIVMSKTGSGKTGAFGLPMLQMINSNEGGPYGLVLTPTRELAVQVNSDFAKMAKYTSLLTTTVYGQHSMEVEIKALNKGVAIVTGTPGRVADHIKRRTLKTRNLEFLVLDEADRMLDMGFIDQVVSIIKALPRKRVTMLFSATMPSGIQRICRSYMNDPITIELETETKTVDSIKQIYYRVERNEKRIQLDNILKAEQPDACMVFCNTRIEVDKVQSFLHNKGYVCDALHGANSQGSRMNTINKFKKGKLQILVATDVAARGIHIEDLSLVINYDIPFEMDGYVHRIGRTGRAGNSGKAITLVTSEDIISLYEIEEHVGVLIEEEVLPTKEEIEEVLKKADGKWVGVEVDKKINKKRHENKNQGSTKSDKKHSKKKYENKKQIKTNKDFKRQEINKVVERPNKEAIKKPSHKQPVISKNPKVYNKPRKTKPKVKTKIIQTKLGPIEMRIPEKENKSLFNKISKLFTGNKK